MTEENHVTAITGTTRGIGRGLAERYLSLGYRVAGCSRGEATIEHSNYLHARADVADDSQVRAWAHSIEERWGRVDVLVNAAGISADSLVHAGSSHTWHSVI